MQPIHYTNEMHRSLDFFFFQIRSLPKICEKEMEDQENQKRTSTVSNTTEGFGSSMK